MAPFVAAVAVLGETETELTEAVGVGVGDGVGVGTGVEGVAVAVALSCTTTGFESVVVVIARVPTAVPGFVAAKAIWKLLLAPGASWAGTGNPAVLKPTPATVTCLIATLLLEMLVAVTVCEPVVPTTVATETVFGVTVSVAEAGCGSEFEFAAVDPTPPHPAVHMDAARTADRNSRTAQLCKRGRINMDLLSLVGLFLRRSAIRCASKRWRGQIG